MANYEGTARSNYFQVKNEEEFTAWCNKRNLTCWQEQIDGKQVWAIASEDGGWPNYEEDEEGDNDGVFFHIGCKDIGCELRRHLLAGECAILLESGHEKFRYVIGNARMITAEGHDKFFDMEQEIVKLARNLGYNPTDASY